MTSLSAQDIEDIFQRLRGGAVPERGLDAYVVGVDRELGELRRMFTLVGKGSGQVKFLRGGYGCGKTFMARLSTIEAQKQGFATSFVVVSDNDLKFHRFDEVYRKVVAELATASCARGALGDILHRWIGKIEQGLAEHHDVDAPDFDAKVGEKLAEELTTMIGPSAPAEFIRGIQTVFELEQAGKLSDATALLSWLSGSGNVSANIKRLADIKGEIGSNDAMAYLRGIVGMIHAAGYKGLVIVIDEAETILRMRRDSRGSSLNGIRQIFDASPSFPHLLWIFTGTPEFFDSRHGVGGLEPLHNRISFSKSGENGEYVNVRQPQLELRPFNEERLRAVAKSLRNLYPATDRERFLAKLDDAYIDEVVGEVSKGLGKNIGLVPRRFLRELVNTMDLVEDVPGFDPRAGKFPVVGGLSPEEQAAAAGLEGEDEGPIAVEQVW
jgi:hypothetical protein